MTKKPNILFLMTDQMQGRVLNPDNPCQTPNLDRLAARGIRFTRAYTPNAVCSPARASLMTGLLPHNHGVLYVTHTVDDDQACLRTEYPHWAQRLVDAGYQTGYFGKWHIERSGQLADFGWQESNELSGRFDLSNAHWSLEKILDSPPGYRPTRFYGVFDVPPEERGMGKKTSRALEFLDQVVGGDAPWCCFVSVTEPHDPFFCSEEAFAQYDVDSIELQPNVRHDLTDRPSLYSKAARVWQDWTDQEHKEAAVCYYASITEIDQQFGRLLDRIEEAGELENTIVVFTSDHGEFLGAHGLYCKNISAAEEAYNIPLVMAGPGIASGQESEAIVGLHDLCPTLLELTNCPAIESPDSKSFMPVLVTPDKIDDYQIGYAEYFGGRMILTQRIIWDGLWKYVFNGFDLDELYHLGDDPYELHNIAEDSFFEARTKVMLQHMWKKIRDTGDHSLHNSHYPVLRVAPFGPLIGDPD